jgi:hypothetical protein
MKFLLVIALMIPVGLVSAQSLRVYWSKSDMRIGEQVTLNLEVRDFKGDFQFDPVNGSIPCKIRQKGEKLWQQSGEMEVLDFKDTVLTKNGLKTWKGVYTITAWDTAQYQFPLIRFRLNGKELTGNVLPLTVNFEKKKVDADIVEAEVPDVDDSMHWFLAWGWIVLCLLFGLLFLFLWNRQKRISKLNHQTLKQRTLEKLAKLQLPDTVDQQELARYYVAFSGILRVFLGERYGLNFLERTSQETCIMLRMKEVDTASIDVIRDLLQTADLIKFGKVAATETLMKKHRSQLEQLVHLLSPLEIIA